MAPRKGFYKRFPLHTYQAKKKKVLADLVEKTLECNKEIRRKSKTLKRLQAKVKQVDESSNDDHESSNRDSPVRTHFMSPHTILKRRLSPTSLNSSGKIQGPERSGRRRKLQTKQFLMEVHGATTDNMTPAYEGLFSVANSIPLNELTNLVSRSPRIANKVIPKVVKKS